jgi:hypothetical protein
VEIQVERLEARILENGKLRPVKGFVYYFPECFLVVKVADYSGEMTKDPDKLEFQVKAPGADFRAFPIRGIRYE